MMMDENFNEKIRENIRQAISEGKGSIRISPDIEHLLTSMCFVMFKKGMMDGLRIAEASIIKLKQDLDK